MVRSALIFAAGCLSTFVVLSIVPLKTTPSGTPSAPPASASPTFDGSAYEVQVESDRVSINGVESTKAEFGGSCTFTDGDGSSETKSIVGVAPQTYTFVGHGISCNYQKQRRNDDRLKVTVRRNGEIVKAVATNLEYGSVSFEI